MVRINIITHTNFLTTILIILKLLKLNSINLITPMTKHYLLTISIYLYHDKKMLLNIKKGIYKTHRTRPNTYDKIHKYTLSLCLKKRVEERNVNMQKIRTNDA